MSTKAAGAPTGAPRDKPWIFRTYAGHSTASQSNRLFRANLAKGQTGLSVAFDLPTQTGYDCDHPLAKGEVGKVGVPIGHIGDMRRLFEAIPIADMNTSLTINATAAWLLALYIAVAEDEGVARASLSGTTQNDIIKEYLSRGTYIFPPAPSLRLSKDLIVFATREMPKWNPINICSYHLQEAGATPVQELAFALANAIAVLETVGASTPADLAAVTGRLSFFVNSGMRFVTELAKMRAFAELWDEITRERFAIDDEKTRRFRYGVQVNSLGLTEQQPENNIHRILIEMLPVVLAKNSRARAVQLPAWNEALGLPRPFDQQWSLRMQQILAFETDLLEYDDIFEGSHVIERTVANLKAQAKAELAQIDRLGGALAAVETGYMKAKLVEANSRRLEAIESGAQVVVGVNRYRDGEASPLVAGESAFLSVSDAVETEEIERLKAWRNTRNSRAVKSALADLRRAAGEAGNIMPATIAAAKAGVTTGEWAGVLRELFGQYRAPTGVGPSASANSVPLTQVRAAVAETSGKLGRRIKILIGKPGLDGHSNGAEQIAVRARDAGMEVVYDGIRLTPAEIVNAAVQEGVHCIGLSILSGSHVGLVQDILARMRTESIGDIPLVVGGIIPDHDAALLKAAGAAAVFTPKDFDLSAIMLGIVSIIDARAEQLRADAAEGTIA
jgi:(2R)-ethylmalonyl-CoA mutase